MMSKYAMVKEVLASGNPRLMGEGAIALGHYVAGEDLDLQELARVRGDVAEIAAKKKGQPYEEGFLAALDCVLAGVDDEKSGRTLQTRYLVTLTLGPSFDGMPADHLEGYVPTVGTDFLAVSIHRWGPIADRRSQGWAELRGGTGSLEMRRAYVFTQLGFKRAEVMFHMMIRCQPQAELAELLGGAERLLMLTAPLDPNDPRIIP